MRSPVLLFLALLLLISIVSPQAAAAKNEPTIHAMSMDTNVLLNPGTLEHFEHKLLKGGTVDLYDLEFSIHTEEEGGGGDDGTHPNTMLDIVVFPLPASCHGNMHGCDITRAGIGRLESNGEVLFCCSPEMADKGECRNAGRLLIETTGVSNRAVPIPGGSMDFDQAPSFDSLIELNFEGVYSVLIANCHPRGRAIHMTGGIEWINVPESAQAVMEEEIGTSPHKNNKDGEHKEEAADPSKSTTSDNHTKGHVDHAHHAKTFAETFHEVSFSVKDETKKELEQNEILPFVGIGIAGILIVGIVLRQKNLTRRYHLYDNTDLDELSIAGEDEDEMMDIDLPDTSLPNQRPETTLSVQL